MSILDPKPPTRAELTATYEPKGAAAAVAAGKADANPAYLEKWFSGGTRGKKIVLVGDSTTDFAYGLNRVLTNYYARAGRELEGASVLNYGVNGQTLATWQADTTSRYGSTSTAAQNADLYVLSYGINDVRLGAMSEDTLVTNLSTAVDTLRANGTSTVLLRMPPTFTTTDTGALGFVSPNGSAQAYSTLLRNAYIRTAAAKGCALLDTQALVYGLTSKSDTQSPYMLNQIHPNDAGNTAVAVELVKMIGTAPAQPPAVFSMRGRAAVGVIGRRVLPSGGRVAFGFATYKPTLSGTVTIELRKVVGGVATAIGTATYNGGYGANNVFTPQSAITDWNAIAAGDAIEVAVTTASATMNDLAVYVVVDEPAQASYYPLSLRYNGMVNGLTGAVVYPAAAALDASHERDIRGLKAVTVKRLGYNRITKYSQDFSQTIWTKLNATVAGTPGAQTITATAAGAGVYQVITVTPGEQLTFSWKGTTTAPTPRFAVFDQTNGAYVGGATQAWPAADGAGWRNYTFTVPAGCTSLRVYPVGHASPEGAAGDVHTINATMLSAGTARLTYASTTGIGTSMILSTGALPADLTIIRAVKIDGYAAGQVSGAAAGINTDGNPALQSPNNDGTKFGFPVVATRGTVTKGANGSWQFAVLRATGGNVYVTLNDQPQSTAFAKAVNATDLRLNLLSSTDTTGSFQNWDGEYIGEYYPYLLTEGEAAARVRAIARTLLAAGETVTGDWPAQKLA